MLEHSGCDEFGRSTLWAGVVLRHGGSINAIAITSQDPGANSSPSSYSRSGIARLRFETHGRSRATSLPGDCSSVGARLPSRSVLDDEFYGAELALLQALQRQDRDTLAALLTEDFVITTAGWIAEPADKPTWLAGLGEHQLDEFELRLVTVRRYDDVAVVLVESAQKGSRLGESWAYTFRYTGVWLHRNDGWLLAVRHASAVHPE